MVQSMRGLGDSIYQRPFIRQLAVDHDVYLRTPWPELFEDIHYVRFMRDPTRLRTQAKNVARNRRRAWNHLFVPSGMRKIKVWYGIGDPYRGILPDMATVFGVAFDPALFTLPAGGASPVQATKPIALVRPVTIRSEWANPARNCLPVHIQEAVAILRERFHVVSVADTMPGVEWFEGEPPTVDTAFHRGELDLPALLALIHQSAVIVGSVGWIAPAAAAARRPAILIAGGQGAWNAPELIYSPAVDTSRVRWIMPDAYCRCAPSDHACDKTITGFSEQFRAALAVAA